MLGFDVLASDVTETAPSCASFAVAPGSVYEELRVMVIILLPLSVITGAIESVVVVSFGGGVVVLSSSGSSFLHPLLTVINEAASSINKSVKYLFIVVGFGAKTMKLITRSNDIESKSLQAEGE